MNWSPPCEYVIDVTRYDSHETVVSRTYACVRHGRITTGTDGPCGSE